MSDLFVILMSWLVSFAVAKIVVWNEFDKKK